MHIRDNLDLPPNHYRISLLGVTIGEAEIRHDNEMAINSQNIIHAVQIAIDAGNSVKEISEGWLKVQQVIYMKYRLTSVVRKKIALEEPTLR